MLRPSRIGFIGFGNMAAAMANGMINGSLYKVDSFRVCDPLITNGTKKTRFSHVESNHEVAKWADLIIIASKPAQVPEICKQISAEVNNRNEKPLILSVAAGVAVDTITHNLGSSDLAVVRAMPNTPCLIREGMTGYFANTHVSEEARNGVQEILESMGDALEVDKEELLHAVTAVCGSGPAYFFRMIEHLTDAGVGAGLPREQALRLAKKTARGAGMLACDSELLPAELRRQVTSKGGTTDAGLSALDRSGFGSSVHACVQAAMWRSIELSKTS